MPMFPMTSYTACMVNSNAAVVAAAWLKLQVLKHRLYATWTWNFHSHVLLILLGYGLNQTFFICVMWHLLIMYYCREFFFTYPKITIYLGREGHLTSSKACIIKLNISPTDPWIEMVFANLKYFWNTYIKAAHVVGEVCTPKKLIFLNYIPPFCRPDYYVCTYIYPSQITDF